MAEEQDDKQRNRSGRGFGKPFEKGQSGNPGGRPKGAISLTTVLRQQLTEGDAQTIVNNLIRLATTNPTDAIEAKLHQWAVDTILERLDGKVTQPLSGDTDNPLRFVIDPGKSLASNASD